MKYVEYINVLSTIIIINDYIIKNNIRKNFPILLKNKIFNNTDPETVLKNTKIENFNKIFSNTKNKRNPRGKYKNNTYINYNKRENYKSY